jgi:hypothetical protein
VSGSRLGVDPGVYVVAGVSTGVVMAAAVGAWLALEARPNKAAFEYYNAEVGLTSAASVPMMRDFDKEGTRGNCKLMLDLVVISLQSCIPCKTTSNCSFAA